MVFPNRKNTFVYFDGGEFKTSKIKFAVGKVSHYRVLELRPDRVRDGVILDEEKNIYPVNKKLLLKGFIDDRQALTKEQAETLLTGLIKPTTSVKKRSGSKAVATTTETNSKAVQSDRVESVGTTTWDELSKIAQLAHEEQIGAIYYSQN